jgi:DNA-binding LacI/PurR family transcriptional regulator
MSARSTKRGRPAGEARYKIIAREIAQRVRSGEWAPGTHIPSSRKLEADYRVSTKTLLRALQVVKKEGLVHFGQRQLPVATLGVPLENILGDTVAVIFSRPLSLIVSDEAAWRGAMYNGVIDGSLKTEWSFFILHGRRWRNEVPSALFNMSLRGVLLIGCPFTTEILKQYEAFTCPVILVDRPAAGLSLHSISPANHQMMFDATSRLIAMGHRQIALLRELSGPAALTSNIAPVEPDVFERTSGFEAACAKAGFGENQFRIFTSYGPGSTVKELLSAQPAYSAVVTTSAGLAVELFQKATEARLQIPRDLSIVTILSGGKPAPNATDWSGPRIEFSEFGEKAMALLRTPPKSRQDVRISATWHEGATALPPSLTTRVRKSRRNIY